MAIQTPSNSSSNPTSNFVELEVLQDADDQLIIAPITYRVTGQGEKLHSFSVLRRYDTNANTQNRTPWFHRRHIARLVKFLPEIERHLVEAEARALEERGAFLRRSR